MNSLTTSIGWKVDPALAMQAIDLCCESYEDNAPDFRCVGDLCYGIREVDGVPTVIVRGTKNIQNWLRDVRAFPIRSCYGNLSHAGAVNGFKMFCKDGLFERLPATGPIYGFGHSLGGGLVREIAKKLGTRMTMITIGAMKTDLRWGATPALNHLRIITDDDPIIHLPGMLYKQDCEPSIILDDHDHEIIDVKDHFAKVYRARWKKLYGF